MPNVQTPFGLPSAEKALAPRLSHRPPKTPHGRPSRRP